jgi:methenyltetrahydrofolate cyclohydrolase
VSGPGAPERAGYLGMPVGEFLDVLAAARPDPGGGSAAALTVALAAALCAMTADLSARHLPQAPRLAADARRLLGRAAPLAQADADAYGEVIAALRAARAARNAGRAAPGAEEKPPGTTAEPSAPGGAGGTAMAGGQAAQRDGDRAAGREDRVARALAAASAVPLAVTEIGDGVAALAAEIAAGGNPNVHGDALTAARLAAAAAQAAAALVRINLADAPEDPRLARATHLAARAARRADGAGPGP